jgi:DNA-binding ferritin-like protein
LVIYFLVGIGLSAEVRHKGVAALNRSLAHTLAVRDLYKKAHWQTHGVTSYQLHLPYDKHAEEQALIADELAERIQTLGASAWCSPPTLCRITDGACATPTGICNAEIGTID